MAMTDRIVRLFGRKPKPDISKSVHWNSTAFSGRQNPLLKALQNCSTGDPAIDPRANLELYRKIFLVLPFVQRAITTKWVLVGDLQITINGEVNDLAKRLQKDFVDVIPIRSVLGSDWARGHGLSQHYRVLGTVRDRDGEAFAQDEINPDTGRMDAIRLFNPADFTPVVIQGEGEVLRFSGNGVTKDITRHDEFFTRFVRYYMPEYTWGLPLTWGTEEFSSNLIRSMIANTNARLRLGNPVGMTLISMDTDKLIAYNSTMRGTNTKPLIDELRDSLKTQISNAQESAATQRPEQVVGVIPAGSISQEVLGKGINPMPGYKEEFELFAKHIIIKMGIPAEFAGIFLGGGGLGSDKWRIMRGIFQADIEAEQNEVRHDATLRTLNWATTNGIRLQREQIGWNFTTPDLSDKEIENQTALTAAQASQMQIENFANLKAELGNDVADLYAESLDVSWLSS